MILIMGGTVAVGRKKEDVGSTRSARIDVFRSVRLRRLGDIELVLLAMKGLLVVSETALIKIDQIWVSQDVSKEPHWCRKA